jgi:hypothetical protein
MVNKRGRKRTNEMYFGPNEEEAVIKFLSSRYVETVDLIANKHITITHKLGKDVVVKVIPYQMKTGMVPIVNL